MPTSILGTIIGQDIQPGESLIDGGTIRTCLNPQTGVAGLIALAGGGATNATPLILGHNEIDTVATGNDSVLLPLALQGATVTVFNATGSNSALAWPQQSNPNNALAAADTIVNLAGTVVTSLAIAANAVVSFRCFKPGVWKGTV
jgi:hypothetical protein